MKYAQRALLRSAVNNTPENHEEQGREVTPARAGTPSLAISVSGVRSPGFSPSEIGSFDWLPFPRHPFSPLSKCALGSRRPTSVERTIPFTLASGNVGGALRRGDFLRASHGPVLLRRNRQGFLTPTCCDGFSPLPKYAFGALRARRPTSVKK